MIDKKNTLGQTYLWFVVAVPEPTDKNVHTQIGVHFEEVGEMLDEMKGTDARTETLIRVAGIAIKELAHHLKTNNHALSIEHDADFLDSLCDQIVTATGVGRMLEYDMIGAMNEVNASNYSKFDEQGRPMFNADQKIIKSPLYYKADMEQFV